MANEITLTGSLAFAKGNVASVSRTKSALSVTVTGTRYHQGVQNVGTTEEQLVFGDVSTPGYCLVVNLDNTNYVEIRPATGVADLIRIPAGKFALFPFAPDCTAPFVIANTSSVDIEKLLIEA